MHKTVKRALTGDEIQTYRRDGVVLVRGLIDPDWVVKLQELVDENIIQPSTMVREINEPGGTGNFFGDTFVCHHISGFRSFIFESPAADVVSACMGSSRVNLIFDQILAKEPGTSTRTTWHHDAPYWPVAGDMIATVWVALDPVTYDTGAVEYIRGSHQWGKRFAAVSFSPGETYHESLDPVPDIDNNRDAYDFACFEMEPGDCTIHHGLTVHGAPGNSSTCVRRRAYITRWAGEDVTYNPRPNLQRMLRDPKIEAGQRLDCDLFPVVREGLAPI